MNSPKKLFFAGLLIVPFLAGCDISITTENKNVTKIEVVEETIAKAIKFDKFDQAGIKLKITYSDQSFEEKTITKAMLPASEQEKLNKAGTYNIDIFYRKQHTTFDVTIDCYHVVFKDLNRDTAEYEIVGRNDSVYKLADVVYPTTPEGFELNNKVYTFTGWSVPSYSKLEDLVGPNAIKALYNDEFASHTVKFFDGNEDLIGEAQKVNHAEDAVAPSVEARAMDGYLFCCWDRAFTNVVEDINVYGIYYKVTEDEPVDNAKTYAKTELEGYADPNDYRDAEKLDLATAIADGKTAIDAATTISEVYEALGDAEDVINQIKTDEELTEEEAQALALYKANAKNTLDTYKNPEDYREAEKVTLTNAIADGKAAIDAATDEAGVDSALAAAKAVIDTIKTAAELDQEEAELPAYKAAAIEELESYADPADYRDAEKVTLAAAVADGTKAINDATNKPDVDKALADAEAVIDEIKTNEELTAEEQQQGQQIEKTVSIAEVASTNGWADGTKYASFKVDKITFTATGTTNTGKYYESDNTWRIYASESGTVTIAVESGYELVSVSYAGSPGFTEAEADATLACSGASVVLTASGKSKIASFTVTYQAAK